MDAPTADNEVVLASMGGKPRTPETTPEDAGADAEGTNRQSPGTSRSTEEEKWSAVERGVVAPGHQGLRERPYGVAAGSYREHTEI